MLVSFLFFPAVLELLVYTTSLVFCPTFSLWMSLFCRAVVQISHANEKIELCFSTLFRRGQRAAFGYRFEINYCLCCHLIAASQWTAFFLLHFPPQHAFAPCQKSSSTCDSVWVLCMATHPPLLFPLSVAPSLPPLLPVFNYTPLWPLLYLLQPQHECKQSKSLGTLKYAWLSVTDR